MKVKKRRKHGRKHNNFCSLKCMIFEQNRFTDVASTEKVKSKKKKYKSGVYDNVAYIKR
jgi:hypothetical protein